MFNETENSLKPNPTTAPIQNKLLAWTKISNKVCVFAGNLGSFAKTKISNDVRAEAGSLVAFQN